ncbi:DnaJ domain-containing protein [Obelidium mucronatum]|nr:DnaJ domain-containing protein [Obelidium mucronatum]
MFKQPSRAFGKTPTPSPLPWKHASTPYALLGVNKSASAKEIKRRYYELSFSYHPDRTLTKPDQEKEKMNHEFLAIQDAYELLKDDRIRREYDLGGPFGYAVDRTNKGGGSSAYQREPWTMQEKGTQPQGEMKIFRPWAYGVFIVAGTLFFMTRSVVGQREESRRQAWEDWEAAKRAEGVYSGSRNERR